MDFSINGQAIGAAAIDDQGDATVSNGLALTPGTYTITASYAEDSVYGPGTATTSETVTTGTPIYSYFIMDANGGPDYDDVDNVTSFSDSVMGRWTMGTSVMTT